MNKVILLGNITNDLELKKTQTNKSYLTFNVAVNEMGNKTTFITCQAWEKNAELISSFFEKGSKVLLEGRIANSTYETHETQNGKITKTYVVVDRFEFVESKKKEPNKIKDMNVNDLFKTNDDDLPF